MTRRIDTDIRRWALAALAAALVTSPLVVAAQESGEQGEDRPRLAQAESGGEGESEGDESSGEGTEGDGEPQQSSDSQLQRGDQMEFDARLIRGERASGAVFLFQRTPRKLPSMVERRRSYLTQSVRSVLGLEWAETLRDERDEGRDSGDDEEESSEDPEGDVIDRLAAEQDDE